jgi:hypothetical protein
MRRINRKSQEFKFIYLVLWAVIAAIVLLEVKVFTTSFARTSMDIRDAEARIFANRILYSPEGISYFDVDLGRSHLGAVDFGRVDSSILDNALMLEDNQVIAAKVVLKNLRGLTLKEAIYNEVWYMRWLPLAGRRGSGAASEIIEKRYALIYENDNFREPGIVEIQMLVPNS